MEEQIPAMYRIFKNNEESLDFVYSDEDSFSVELSEFYSYSEIREFTDHQILFYSLLKDRFQISSWKPLEEKRKKLVILHCLDLMDSFYGHERLIGIQCILYLAQGTWLECQSDSECINTLIQNVEVLYTCGVFYSFVEYLNRQASVSNESFSSNKKSKFNLGNSMELRSILGVLYAMVLVLRSHSNEALRLDFVDELNTPMEDNLLSIRLLHMITQFCSGVSPDFPMKKILCLLWKVLLTSLGGISKLSTLKNELRAQANLPEVDEDTITISKTMRAESPPNNVSENITPGLRKLRPGKSIAINLMMDNVCESLENIDQLPPPPLMTEDDGFSLGFSHENEKCHENEKLPRSLPWKPKVRQKDIDNFLNYSRRKFVGFTLMDDRTTLAGLPAPLHESIHVLNQHTYTSLSEIQIQREENIARYPISQPEPEVRQTPTEILYTAMLQSLPQFMIALLKILLAAAPTSKAKTDSINILSDVMPHDIPLNETQSMKLSIDVNRHKEILVKSVSAILLLLLKHLKINHIYQFEFMSQHLVFANCIPLVLKFFNQNISAYIGSQNNIPLLDFPSCVLGEQPEMSFETLTIGDNSPYSWRNMFSCINLLRVLNKLTKWKHSRIMMLVVFKSAPILKTTLHVKHALFQLYVLKLLKMQTKYLGRQWRKINMKIISSIYTKVRHGLHDDWAYGNDTESRPWDFQAEECSLRAAVDRFNHRRYDLNYGSPSSLTNQSNIRDLMELGLDPVNNCLFSALSQNVKLTQEFKFNYEKWLSKEVFETEIKWELLLDNFTNEL